ncbi:hypothetical protein SELMODRAFT_89216 [Selaginella moellendorffii]|uniref:Uncharacterized protein n=1 Tax=Selaginella moellendorffii TaxID=88036 RepID=D8RBL7_SELML|nr:uncharacterized protein LOC9631440 isoform X2 [Selaginella moellendorffii]EFJ30817.1 hypothetical protein SELMODRAFT_89216 [Selaginella moellendorffii]|eukprot:XP_002968563.1 uncharacterized protein LOC9631440 isoform X2 [Selaginella moellendorffii]
MLHCSPFVSPTVGSARVCRIGLLAVASASILQRRGFRSLAAAAASLESEVEEDFTPQSGEKKRLPHTPVLVRQFLEHFEGRSVKTFLDCTVGAGGHAFEIIQAHPELETFVGMDVDPCALKLARQRLSDLSGSMAKVDLFHANFKNMKKDLKERNPELLERGFDGILLDLGLSSMQVDAPERGFSYYLDGPLDMRMDSSDVLGLTAEAICNNWSAAEIGRILREYGEEMRWKFLASRIVDARLNGGIKTTKDLASVVGGRFTSGRFKRARHPAARTFQALRIAVNDELKSLRSAIGQASSCLAPGGRLAVISFHSLEDRIVKYQFKELSLVFDKVDLAFMLLTTSPITADAAEIEKNSRCRSAKMRVIQRLCR